MIPVLIKEGHVKDEEGYKDLSNGFEVAEMLCPEDLDTICSDCGKEILPNSLNHHQNTYPIIRCDSCYLEIFK